MQNHISELKQKYNVIKKFGFENSKNERLIQVINFYSNTIFRKNANKNDKEVENSYNIAKDKDKKGISKITLEYKLPL